MLGAVQRPSYPKKWNNGLNLIFSARSAITYLTPAARYFSVSIYDTAMLPCGSLSKSNWDLIAIGMASKIGCKLAGSLAITAYGVISSFHVGKRVLFR